MFHNKGYRWPDEIPVGISEDTPDDKQSATPLLLNSIKQVDTAIMAAVVSPTKMSLISADGRYLLDTFKEVFFIMISVGIDVSKEKSTVCAIKPYGEVLMTPKDFKHTKDDLDSLVKQLSRFKEEIHIIMEATGNYHLPIYRYLKSKDYMISIINPLEMKRYRCQGIRNPKTDKIDSMIIAQYGIDYWYRFKPNDDMEEERQELRLLGIQYTQFMKTRVIRCQALCEILDRTMPGVYGLLDDFNRNNGQDKLCDFAEKYWHSDNITKYSEKAFIERYNSWLKKKGYRQNEKEARQLYSIAKNAIPTLDSKLPSTKLLVQETVNVLREVDSSLYDILNQLKSLSKEMPEYETVLHMKGIGETLAPRFIAEIGDPRRFHSAKALIAYAGIDAPPYQSGQFTGTKRHISKRGSSNLRKLGYELMDSVNKHKSLYSGDPVCEYFMKKRNEGKPYRVAMIAAFNKFLRIYHSKVSEVLNDYDKTK